MKIEMIENSGGGLQIECELNGEFTVISGLEFSFTGGINEFISYGDSWYVHDASNGYYPTGNSLGDTNEDGVELTSYDMSDESEYSKVIAVYDGNHLVLSIDRMGNSGKKYFGLI